ncbi:MAG TPA: hypothetical protein VFS36_06410 [Chitinophagaceae bacterium]|nr:hypothetical protein [Chitinophagaceae bacterium]
MKSIVLIFVLLISMASRSQNLDTVLVRNLQLQAQDWAWLVGDAPIYADSSSAANFRRIRDKVRADNPASWTTNVTVDSLAGKVVMYFYQKTKTANAGEIAARYTAITSAIAAKTNLSSFITAFDDALAADYVRRRNNGRYVIMDN